ncbi:hypothetical protein CP157_03884 (plasmid) [Paracoccus marcusii]|uniref:hypothetical protein n=1 Tax=Paracoccus marcusii TaxID=59779 RepID=UPI001C3E0B8E|nr:hypothetical protein [Paracoccus marcusii]QXI66092.1 hypothetical protein CP157_03884 [Paracoccus marcusii]
MQSIVDFWKQLDGAVHPQDAPVFERHGDHGFNLDYPPPAYIGDILNAPVIILENNGGYDPVMTPGEFPDAEAQEAFRASLAAPAPFNPNLRHVSPYYCSRNYTHLLVSGQAALVNAVAYRSVDGKAPGVKALSRALPSARLHRDWLTAEVLPLVNRGERFLVIHRWGRWLDALDSFKSHSNAIFSSAQISKDLSRVETQALETFLRRGG